MRTNDESLDPSLLAGCRVCLPPDEELQDDTEEYSIEDEAMIMVRISWVFHLCSCVERTYPMMKGPRFSPRFLVREAFAASSVSRATISE